MSIINTTKVIFYTISESLKIINKMKEKGSDEFFSASKKWAKELLKKAKIEVEVINNNFDKNRAYIIVVNHSSYLDIPVLLAYLDLPFVIIYKKELEKIPIFGKGLELSPFISVIRTSPRDAVRSLDKSVELLKSGVSVLIFPEGTRSKNGELGEFKKGATRLAYKSNSSILPVKLINTHQLMPKNSFIIKKGKVSINIKQEIQFDNFKDITEDELLLKLKEILNS